MESVDSLNKTWLHCLSLRGLGKVASQQAPKAAPWIAMNTHAWGTTQKSVHIWFSRPSRARRLNPKGRTGYWSHLD